ncbi:MAG: ABC transporter substrate-binding protein, partial [Chloroflexota bacterium]|nr:ABC transporter substrate-binding protein [Chloroflexota bacterium]
TGGGAPTPPAGGTTATAAAAPAAGPPKAPAALKRGGILKIATTGEPPSLADAMFTTATATANVAEQMFEGLFARDSKFAPRPMLVERHTASPDGKSYEFTLRRGVKFHNGKDLAAADVVASLRRWGQLSSRGKLIFGRLDGIAATDAATVTMTFKEPTGVLLDFLALSEAFILPAEVADAAGKNKLENNQLIGTGPFMFKEHQVDRYIRLVRFDGYTPREEAPDGVSGKKVAYLDELQLIPVPDESVRVNGLITGEYHFNESVPPDQYDTVRNDQNLTALTVRPNFWYCPHFNKKQGIFTDVRMRQAVVLAFSQAEAMVAGFGRQEFIRLDPGVSAPETVWYSTAGGDVYNKPDPERARALLREAGYNGQTVRWLCTKESIYSYNMSEYIKQKLEAVGMKVELVVSDWATVIKNRANAEGYEVHVTGHSAYAHPALHPFNDKAWPGFWDNAEKDRLVGAMVAEADAARQKQTIDDYQALVWRDMPFVKCGENFALRAARKEVAGYTNTPNWFFWNVALG